MVTSRKTRSGTTRAKKSVPAAGASPPGKARRDETDTSNVQGEGDYASAREFNREEREFVTSHDTEDLARRAAPGDTKQAEELEAAERKGKSRARPDPDAEQPAADAGRESGGDDEAGKEGEQAEGDADRGRDPGHTPRRP